MSEKAPAVPEEAYLCYAPNGRFFWNTFMRTAERSIAAFMNGYKSKTWEGMQAKGYTCRKVWVEEVAE